MKLGFSHILLMLIFIYTSLSGCKKDTFEDISLAKNYFPLLENLTWYYEVDSIVFSEENIDSFKYYEKWMVTNIDSNMDNNNIGYIEIQTRNDTTDNWTYAKTIKVEKLTDKIILWNDNVPYVRLALPLSPLKTWDINMSNNFPRNQATVESTDNKLIYKDSVFNYGLIVSEIEIDNIIQQKKGKTTYIPDLGILNQKYIYTSLSGGDITSKRGYEITRILQ